MSAVFQRCRTSAKGYVRDRVLATSARRDKYLEELLALSSEILNVVDQQGKFLIDVPEDWVPQTWVSAVKGDTQRGIEYMQAMQLSHYDVLTPEKRRQVSLLQLLVRELQRLWAIGGEVTVYRLGYAFHNVHRDLRTPEKPDTENPMGMFRVIRADWDMLSMEKTWSMGMFRVISADWDMLSMEMREGCCRVMGLEVQAAEELISTRGFSINCSGPRRRKIDTLISRSTALHQQGLTVTVLGTVREVTVHPPILAGEDGTMLNAYSLVLEDETGTIAVEVIGNCRPGESVPSYQGKRVVIDGTVEVLSQGVTNRPLVRLKAQAGELGYAPVRLMVDDWDD